MQLQGARGVCALRALVCFSADVIQYGIDLLHDAPMEDSILYVSSGMSGQATLDYFQ